MWVTTSAGGPLLDIVVVVHNDKNKQLAANLIEQIYQYMTQSCDIFIEDNSVENLGFSKACNIGAAKGSNPYIGFLNPDCVIIGDFITPVINAFESDHDIVITGGNFNKNPVEIAGWGCNDWVCGAAMFVKRAFWEAFDGFDEQFVWAYEETDLIRRAEAGGLRCKSLSPEELPILHSSPIDDSPEDAKYKAHWMAESGSRFWRKWK